jgi:transcription elongation factor Elf1
MTFNAKQFLTNYKVASDPAHHHASPGWIAIQTCPFCNSTHHHFGMHESSGACNCWKCGPHGLLPTVMALAKVDDYSARKVIAKYTEGDQNKVKEPKRNLQEPQNTCHLPVEAKPMIEVHSNYLLRRKFDPERLERDFGLLGIGIVPGCRYNMRIIIPIYHKGILVSYQGRDVTGDSHRIRYKACMKINEARHHKHCLYGLDKVKGKSILITEGVTKVWRMGEGSVATFGIIWTLPQEALLLDFERIFILFDKGEQAQERAYKLAYGIGTHVKCAEVIELDDVEDPGDLEQDDANALMRDLGIRR